MACVFNILSWKNNVTLVELNGSVIIATENVGNAVIIKFPKKIVTVVGL